MFIASYLIIRDIDDVIYGVAGVGKTRQECIQAIGTHFRADMLETSDFVEYETDVSSIKLQIEEVCFQAEA